MCSLCQLSAVVTSYLHPDELQAAQHGQVKFQVRTATTPAELRAAGYLRACTFYSYPPDRSEYSRRVSRFRQPAVASNAFRPGSSEEGRGLQCIVPHLSVWLL